METTVASANASAGSGITIDLSMLCKAAARNDRKSVAALLQIKRHVSTTPTGIRTTNSDDNHDKSNHNHNHSLQFKSSVYAMALLDLLFDLPNTNTTSINMNMNCVHKYFSNVIICAKHVLFLNNNKTTFENDIHSRSITEQEENRNIKNQLLMTCKSLLLLPWYNNTPWDTINATIQFIISHHQQHHQHTSSSTDTTNNANTTTTTTSLFQYYFIHDILFTSNILSYIQNFIQMFQSEMEKICSSTAIPLSLLLQYYDKVQNIQNLVQTILLKITKSIFFFQQENQHLEHPNNNNNSTTIINTRTPKSIFQFLFEIIVLIINTGSSIDSFFTYYYWNTNNNHYHTTTTTTTTIHHYEKDEKVVTKLLNILYSTSSLLLLEQQQQKQYGINNIIMNIHIMSSLLLLSKQKLYNYMNNKYWNIVYQLISNTFYIVRNDDEICNQLLLSSLEEIDDDDSCSKRSNMSIENDILDILQQILGMIVYIIYKKDDDDNSYHDTNPPSWITILIDIYTISRFYPSLLKKIDSQIYNWILDMTPECCILFIDKIVQLWSDDDHHHKSIIITVDNNEEEKGDTNYNIESEKKKNDLEGSCLNILLIILHCRLKYSNRLVSHLLSISLDGNDVEKSHDTAVVVVPTDHLFIAILSFANTPMVEMSFKLNNYQLHDFESLINVIQYEGNGIIKSSTQITSFQKDVFGIFESFVKIMYRCIAFHKAFAAMNDSTNRNESYMVDQIQRFIDVAESIVESNKGHEFHCNKIFLSVAIFVTLFMEVDSSRTILIKYFTHVLSASTTTRGLCGNNLAPDPKHVICWALACIRKTWMYEQLGNGAHGSLNINIEQFQPLCGVLVELGDGQKCMTLSTISELMNILSLVPNGRKSILKIVHENLIMTNNIDEWKIRGRCISQERRVGIALEGLTTLLKERKNAKEHIDACTLDEFGLEAFIRIVNLLVLKRPSISLQSRTLLFSKLCLLTEKHDISCWVANRLLAATIMAILPYFRITPSQHLIFSPICESNHSAEFNLDLNSLTMIAVQLVQYESKFLFNMIELPFSSDEIDALVPIKRIPQKASSGNESIPSLRSIALSCVGAVITYLTQSAFNNHDMWNTSQYLDSLIYQKKIREKEFECFRDLMEIGQNNKVQQNWHEYLNPKVMTIQVEQSSSSLLMPNPSTYDCLVNILIKTSGTVFPKDSQSHFNSRSVERMLRLLSSIGLLTDAKQRNLQSNLMYPPKLHGEANVTNITKFFVFAVETLNVLLEGRLNESKELSWLISLLNAMMNYCDVMQNFFESVGECHNSTFVSHIEAIQAMWSFYNSCCNEIKSCELIDYIEAHIGEQSLCSDDATTSTNHQNSLDSASLNGTFATVEKIYYFIRKFRYSFISCFNSVFQFHEKQNIWKNNKDNYFVFCVDVACTLTHDLSSGLNGVSGGITRTLYQCYIQTIEEAVQSCLQNTIDNVGQPCQDFDYDLLSDMKSNCTTAITSLWNVIHVFNIKHPSLFKSNYQLCSISFPQLLRRIERIMILNFPTVPLSENITVERDIDVEIKGITIMKDVIDMVEAGMDRNEEKKRINSHNDLESRTGIKSILSNEKLLEWTLESSIIMVEKLWNETWQNHQDDKTTASTQTHSIKESSSIPECPNHICYLLPVMKGYATKRCSVTYQSLSTISSLLQIGQEKGFETHLSIKRRVYTLLERIFVTLKVCIQFMTKHFQEDESLMNEDKQVLFAESISCVIAWISIPDFTISIWKYHAKIVSINSSQKLTSTSSSSSLSTFTSKLHITNRKKGRVSNNDLDHGRMTKIIRKMEQIDKLLNPFYHKMVKKFNPRDYYYHGHQQQQQQQQQHHHQQQLNIMTDVDHLIQQFMNEKDISFLQIMNEYMDQISSEKELVLQSLSSPIKMKKGNALLSSPSSKTSSFTTSKLTTSSTNNIKKHVDKFKNIDNRTLKKRLKEAQREKKRSRNEVVDEWMYLDCEIDEEDGGGGGRRRRKGDEDDDFDDDNFEDLEDFLLPG